MAIVLKAKEAAELVYSEIAARVEEWKKEGKQPSLAILLVEGDPASAYYARSKQKIAERLGIAFRLRSFGSDVSEEELQRVITELNADDTVHGIMLELPLPAHLSAAAIEACIAPAKDIDGVTPSNKLAVYTGKGEGLYPATPQACIELLKHYGYILEGRNVVLVGRGQTVGLPLFHLLQRENATVTVCHSRTPDLGAHLKHAEIAIVAVGKPAMITKDMVHPGLTVIDAGINELADGKITGDAAADLGDAAAAVSPVPGGVGTLTTAILYRNLMKAIDIQMTLKGDV
ncbi:bifunctional 5,10-methylenetetrahydrofolate dehydrogenase/5,10-methenyltetrahydrofolate cyclohydrolase [Paenibacillus sp. CF384]|uniref:bifunctional 5,10-methylenetetrahydrofolate dehydrogenase/5,10-methenyltetrahydrofolate cyclohydrolase n=1 Tax=Paenibacillus sp. CF384 TaxID=1884382 RepID=UPI0008969F6F|nr:bifunctional 5,10-methylenetetrahydrofolate dehydrogenase/5,10-methenyltetrahydrofolate cyclohydrolase [Paenibacillus sp. CF384]SDW66741.1 methylenetetrahydrofolate dehydrogenase (NADP+) / methenyltetrahydrofolate cyclohydrolase [Paenibacillus sp. CF384]